MKFIISLGLLLWHFFTAFVDKLSIWFLSIDNLWVLKDCTIDVRLGRRAEKVDVTGFRRADTFSKFWRLRKNGLNGLYREVARMITSGHFPRNEAENAMLKLDESRASLTKHLKFIFKTVAAREKAIHHGNLTDNATTKSSRR